MAKRKVRQGRIMCFYDDVTIIIREESISNPRLQNCLKQGATKHVHMNTLQFLQLGNTVVMQN